MRWNLILLALLTAGNAVSQKKKTQFGSMEDAIIFFNAIADSSMSVDASGNVVIDKGSATLGRASFNLKRVQIEFKNEKGQSVMVVRCKTNSCIQDPAEPEDDFRYKKASITLGKTRQVEKLVDTIEQMHKLANNITEQKKNGTFFLKISR